MQNQIGTNIGDKKYLTDHIFITSVNHENRSLGVANLLKANSKFQYGIIFVYNDKKSKTQNNLESVKNTLKTKCSQDLIEIYTDVRNPSSSIVQLCDKLYSLKGKNARLFLDISVFSKRHLLMLLKTIDDFDLWYNMTIFYTEPKNYEADLYLPMSIGIDDISSVNVFISSVSASLPVLLIEFLGYEGDRARAVHDDVDPDETLLIVPKPAYHPEWEGKTERMNDNLISMVGENRLRYASSIDPLDTVAALEKIAKANPPNRYKWIIIPLGTKPQTLGIYLFWKKYPNSCSILYADPLRENQSFSSTGIGKTRILLSPENHSSLVK